MNHLDPVQWLGVAYAVLAILCVLRLWPRGR